MNREPEHPSDPVDTHGHGADTDVHTVDHAVDTPATGASTGSPGLRETIHAPLLWTIRSAAALGLASLSLTGEVGGGYLLLGWGAWALSFGLDRLAAWGQRVRAWENAAVLVLISVFLLDFFVWGYSIFVTVAHFLILFQSFKLLGPKTRKDCLQILIFSFFQLLSACTLSVDAWQGVIFLFLIPVATAGLFWQQISREAETSGRPMPAEAARPYRRWVTVMCLSAIPMNFILASVMFMLFPRLAFRGAFAGFGAGRSGYNEQVNLSQTGTIGSDNSAVLWLQILPERERNRWTGYLRGGTLDVFDGKKWARSRAVVTRTIYASQTGNFQIAAGPRHRNGLRQSITLVNTSGPALLGSPFIGEVFAPLATLQVMSDNSVRWSSGWRKPLRYDVISFDTPYEPLRRAGRQTPQMPDYLQLPSLPLKRTQDLAREIGGRRGPQAQARAIENYLRTEYTYSLDLGDRANENPVEDFLFSRRKGPCGHFASTMAVMLRLQGIPARVAAGYYKGTWNSRVGQFLMRERDAHAWVEAYFPDQGWVSFDPSPRQAPPPVSQIWLLRMQETWGYLNFHWDRLVIEYDLYSQVKVAQDIQSNTQRINSSIGAWADKYLMGFKRQDSGSSSQGSDAKIFIYVLGPGGIVLTGWLLLRRRQQTAAQDAAISFYQKFLEEMARKGFPKSPSETGWEYADRVRSKIGPDPLLALTQRYYQTRFAKR